MRYMLLDETLLIDLDKYYAFEVEAVSAEKGYCVSCWDVDQKSIFKIIPKKQGRDICILVLKEIARIKAGAENVVLCVSIETLIKIDSERQPPF